MKKVVRFILLIILLMPVSVFAQRGCCSHHGGVSGVCKNGKQVCNDGTISPSCTCSGGITDSNYNSNSYSSQITYTPSYIYGCTDKNAINYNANANKDDGSCISKVLGCTDKDAINYNSKANTEDNSCKYEKEIKEKEKIKYSTKYTENNELEIGTENIKVKGQDGEKEVTYIILVDANNNEISKEKKNEIVIKQPTTEIVEKGTNQNSNIIIEILWIISLIIAFYYAFKYKDKNLLLNKIQKQNIFIAIILYILYIITIIPPFIDIILIINNKSKERKITDNKKN